MGLNSFSVSTFVFLLTKIFNFDGSTNADFKCDQSLNLKANITYETKRESNNLLNHLTEPISESKRKLSFDVSFVGPVCQAM